MNDEAGLVSVAEVLDPNFIQESSFNAVLRLASCLDAIGVRPSKDQALKFVDRNIRKHQVVARLFDFWKARIPVTSVPVFIGRVFPESTDGRVRLFQKHWTKAILEDLDPFEARELASFIRPAESLSPSGSAERKILLSLLVSGIEEKVEADDAADAAGPVRQEEDDKASNSLGDFRDAEAALVQDGGKKKSDEKKKHNAKKNVDGRKKKAVDHDDDSSDESSDDDEWSDGESEDDVFAKYCGLSPKFRQIIRHQSGKELSAFFNPHAPQIATKSNLYEVLGHFRAVVQCARALCRFNNLSVSHELTIESYQSKQIPIVLLELRTQPHLSFLMTQRVAPGAIRQFLQAGLIVAYTHALSEKAGSVSKD